MGEITKITKQVKNDERYNIFMDGKYAFSVDESVLAHFQLRKGLELDELMISELQYKDEAKKAFNKVLHFLSYRMRTEKEIRNHLKEAELDDSLIQEVIHKLSEYKYINDKEFAEAFVQTQLNTSDKGPQWIKGELAKKGVDELLVENALTPFTTEIQVDKGVAIAQKLLHKYRKDSLVQAKQKINQNLLRKGYTSSINKIVWEAIETDRSTDEQWEALTHQGMKVHRRLQSKFSGIQYEQKMKQTLYRKGFSLEKIDAFLEKLKNEE